jgi:hypothetical protein
MLQLPDRLLGYMESECLNPEEELFGALDDTPDVR